MNKKGQALIEFILILPAILLIIMSLIDIGNIFLKKYELNNDLDTISELYQNNETKEIAAYTSKEDIIYEELNNENKVTITLKKNIDITAPILSNVLGKDYKIETSKTIYKENAYE